LENAQAMAAHESPRTTKLYDRTGDEITLDEVERITIWPSYGFITVDLIVCRSWRNLADVDALLVSAFVLGRELARSGGNYGEAFSRYEERMRPFVVLNQDMVSVERQGPIPDVSRRIARFIRF
jgi:hypothetical protein